MIHENIPQNREWVYIIRFHSEDAMQEFSFPEEVKLTMQLKDIFESGKVAEQYYYNNKPLYERLVGAIKDKGRVAQEVC